MILNRVWAILVSLTISASAGAQVITVGVAASLGDTLRDISRAFEQEHPGITVRLSVAASGALLQQIIHGAPVDIFISADDETVRRGIAARVIDPASVATLASNTLVLVTPRQVTPLIRRLGDLTNPAVKRVAIGKEASVPAGRYARAAMESARIWASVKPRVIPAENVRQVVEYVLRGEVDAGFVYATDVRSVDLTKITIVETLTGHPPIAYQAATVVGMPSPRQANTFMRYLASEQAQRIFIQHGFLPPTR
jgi:molybdate transport system substrate-binding protein